MQYGLQRSDSLYCVSLAWNEAIIVRLRGTCLRPDGVGTPPGLAASAAAAGLGASAAGLGASAAGLAAAAGASAGLAAAGGGVGAAAGAQATLAAAAKAT